MIARVAILPLFGHLGETPPRACGGRIAAWEDWAGPEVDEVMTIAIRQQDLHDDLIAEGDEEAWRAALQRVVDHTAESLEAEIDDDAWHAPTSAAWQAAWVFCLECVHLLRGLSVPADLQAQITWFERGHWPCALATGREGGDPADYVIF